MPRIYVASSWKNLLHPIAVDALQTAGFDVYDFRHPAPGRHGFHWSQIDRDWQSWGAGRYLQALEQEQAQVGFQSDFLAMDRAHACVLVLPAGASAHLEAGYFAGHPTKKLVILLAPDDPDPSLIQALRGLGHTLDRTRACASCPTPGERGGCQLSTREARAAKQRPGGFEPELMYKLADAVVADAASAIDALRSALAGQEAVATGPGTPS